MYAQVEKTKENKSGAVANSVTQKKNNVKQGFGFVDNRPKSNVEKIIQSKLIGHAKTCGCANCTGTTQMKSKLSLSTVDQVTQLTCDAGHKQHKKGPCPDSTEGKFVRMQEKHGGGKPHGKKGRSRPKKRQEKYNESSLKEVKDRKDDGGDGGDGGAGVVV